mmetsp:Transcript_25713/g.71956  ORF Transcript_25713/g.71956 Transcript_25713/m.71956 type:complete len:110 (+) Transcript_25713:1058-1387(+)
MEKVGSGSLWSRSGCQVQPCLRCLHGIPHLRPSGVQLRLREKQKEFRRRLRCALASGEDDGPPAKGNCGPETPTSPVCASTQYGTCRHSRCQLRIRRVGVRSSLQPAKE